jgi:hypothetical protein
MTSKLFKKNPFFKKLKKLIRKLFKFASKFKKVVEVIELTILYVLAILTLIFNVTNILGGFPELLYKLVPFSGQILACGPLKLLAMPEKTLLLYFVGFELIFNTKTFSLLFKYNVLLVFILEMMENLLICYWDLFLHRDGDFFGLNVIFSREGALAFFTSFFIFFLALYLYCYFCAIMGKFVKFSGPFKKFTDSIAFWFHIKVNSDENPKK